MNDNAPACTRWLYIDTLSRFVGPFMGWRVLNAANFNCRGDDRPLPLSSATAKGAGSAYRDVSPRIYPINPHNSNLREF